MLSNLSQNSQGCNKYTFCLYTSSSHAALYNRVSQKKQKSEFWYATNPSGFHRLDEPPEKFQHYRPINAIVQAIFSFTL